MRLEQIYPFPEKTLGRGTAAVSQGRSGVVPGGAGEHGRLDLRRPAAREGADRLGEGRGDGRTMSDATRRRARQPARRVRMRANRRRWSPRRWGPADMATEIKVPTLGESVTSATVARWMKHEGEAVAADEPLVELETDKVTVEVSAPAAGVLTSISAPEGSEVPVGALLACWTGAGLSLPRLRPASAPAVAEAAGAAAARRGQSAGRGACAAARARAGGAACHAARRCRRPRAAAGRSQADRGAPASAAAYRRRAPARTGASPKATCWHS